MTTNSVHTYIQSLEKELSACDTTEHTHRPALKALLESLNSDIIAINEPQHITTRHLKNNGLQKFDVPISS